VNIQFGCILSFGSSVDIDLPPCRRLTQIWLGDEDDGISFSIDRSPEWLKEYVKNKEPLELPEESNTFEFFPIPEHELPLLRLWLDVSPDTFPIDQSEIKEDSNESNVSEEEEQTACEEDDNNFIQLNNDFQEAADSMLQSLLTKESIDIDQIRSEYVSLKNSKNAEHIDCAAALFIKICEIWDIDKIEEGVRALNSLLSSFLSDEEEQEDFLFWWQGYCSNPKFPQRKELFIKGLIVLYQKSILTDVAFDKWADEQDDCNDYQKALFELYENTDFDQ